MKEEQTDTFKEKRKVNFLALILIFLLIALATLFIFDRFRAQNQLKDLISERDSLVYKNSFLTSQYTTTNDSYNELLSKYNELLDSSLSQSGVLAEKVNELLELQELLLKQDSIVSSVNKLVQDALLGFDSDELKIEIKNGKLYITMQDKLLFASGKADVQEKGIEALKKLADVLNKNENINIEIEGHTDNVPINTIKYADNWDLSVARATSIARVLTGKYKVDSKRITASGRGEFFPLESNSTTEGKAKNRRTEIILSPDLEGLYKLISSDTIVTK
jgi:flagellar motor protein MotB